MAGFVVADVDYDQFGGGEFAAVEELRQQLPVAARLSRQMAGSDRPDYALAVLERPIKYHPADEFDWGRCQSEFVGEDAAGRFVWIYAVIIASLMAGTQLHAGMKGFPVRFAYVIDNTLGRDEQLDFDKCDYISYAMIDDLPEQPTPAKPRVQ
ncbi:hypothetical protein FR943_22400 [Mycobacterium sp. TNTM28]|uniref:Uncharacterized protein n=1 Tax=[Mycobacterium] fortunisiensis TaxID=2600579 RepID=A0ABS6KSW0_9MYCO|nr:hypothetical protein [[Mycobacterium] fortunisiensis]MBU9766579.1 hypothetical protein [[Mycobacterium] fortunisiensis]